MYTTLQTHKLLFVTVHALGYKATASFVQSHGNGGGRRKVQDASTSTPKETANARFAVGYQQTVHHATILELVAAGVAPLREIASLDL